MLKKIKSLFIVKEEVDDKQQDIKQENIKGDQKTEFKSTHKETNKASIDQFFKVLAEAMQNNNIKGYDYLEFKEALRSLDSIEPVEAKKYVTAYTLATTMGAKKENLIKSANFYLDILSKEERKFNSALQKQIDEKILTEKSGIEQSIEAIKLKEQQILKLQAEIKGLKDKLDGMNEEVENATKKVATVKNSFHRAYESIVSQIQEDVDNINNYIK